MISCYLQYNLISFFLSCQTSSTVGAYDDYWKHATQTFQYQHVPSPQSTFQKPLDVNPSHPSVQDQQQNLVPHLPNSQYTEVQQTYPQHLQSLTSAETLRVSNLQIPANPRIASNLALTMPKTIKDTATSSVTVKPAYVSVSLPSSNKVLPSSASDSNLKVRLFFSIIFSPPVILCLYLKHSTWYKLCNFSVCVNTSSLLYRSC